MRFTIIVLDSHLVPRMYHMNTLKGARHLGAPVADETTFIYDNESGSSLPIETLRPEKG